MDRKYYFGALLFVASLMVFGCEKESTTQIETETATQEDESSSAEEFGQAMVGEDEGFLQWSSTPNGTQGTMGESPAEESGAKGSNTIDDTSYTRRGLTINSNWTYYSSDSVAHEAYNAATTVRISHSLSVAGSLVTQRRTASINQTNFVNITGVTPAATEVIFNGGGNRTVESSFQSMGNGVQKSYSGRYVWQVNGLTYHRDRSLGRWPIRGTVTVHATRHRTSVTPGSSRVVDVSFDYTISFDGSDFAECRFPDGYKIWVNLTTGLCVAIRP